MLVTKASRNIKDKIRVIPDFPKPGIRFKDITPLLRDGRAYQEAIYALAEPFKEEKIDLIAGPEARGFLVGAPLASFLGVGFVPVRKSGKLPGKTIESSCKLEYGEDTLSIHRDAIELGQRVLIVDDLLATGGTISSTIDLVQRLDGEVVGAAFLIELSYLNGREKLADLFVHSLIRYEE